MTKVLNEASVHQRSATSTFAREPKLFGSKLHNPDSNIVRQLSLCRNKISAVSGIVHRCGLRYLSRPEL